MYQSLNTSVREPVSTLIFFFQKVRVLAYSIKKHSENKSKGTQVKKGTKQGRGRGSRVGNKKFNNQKT